MVAATVVSLTLRLGIGPKGLGLTESGYDEQVFGSYSLIITTAVVCIVTMAVTFLTKPTDQQTLLSFYRRTRPSKLGWGPIAQLAPDVKITDDWGVKLLQWAMGCAMIYLTLFGFGNIVFGNYGRGAIFLVLALAAAWGILSQLSRNNDDDLWQKN